MSGAIRVLVVDDSALMRKMIPQILSADPDIQVVGTAMDGLFALKKIGALKPDIVTLDVSMPRMDGIATLRHIVRDFGTPVIIVSSLAREHAELTLQALEIGAFDFVAKPQDAVSVNIAQIAEELISKVRAAHGSRRLRPRVVNTPAPAAGRSAKKGASTGKAPERILAIGISTGGPSALSCLLPRIPEDFPAAILIVQHMPPGFTEMFAARLNAASGIEVKEARDGDLVLPGRALIAPGNRHLKVKRLPLASIAVLSGSPPVNGHRPSADVLFRSAADEYGPCATGLIMTGMGSDGAEGIAAIRNRGGMTFAQDEESCVVFGMPKVAIERGLIEKVLSLKEMSSSLTAHFSRREVGYGSVTCG